MDNMKLWHSVCVTDPAAVKPITGKQYKGNSPKPYWIIQRATETFGPCGTGWGVQVVNERFERLTETDVLHVALVRVWYELDGKRGEIEQMGQTKASYKTRDGGTMVDEDAPKKSVTDGMVKCLSMLGFAGDIFSGQWDDSKYVEWAAQETARRENPVMSDAAIADHLAAFEAAETLASLKKAGDLASSIAQAMGDETTMTKLAGAYRKRKKQLTTKEAA